jgi:hypothetical protein
LKAEVRTRGTGKARSTPTRSALSADDFGRDDKIVSIYARRMSVREIQGYSLKLYGLDVSPDLTSTITDPVLEMVFSVYQPFASDSLGSTFPARNCAGSNGTFSNSLLQAARFSNQRISA